MEKSSTFTLSSSFKKKGKLSKEESKISQQPTILTSKSSSNLLTIRTGSADLDALLGGGYVLGALTLIIEDRPTDYWANLIQSGISEALCNGQRVFLKGKQASSLLQNLPVPGKKSKEKISDNESKLTIAWRYGKQVHANLGIADSNEFYYYSYSRSLKKQDLKKEEEQFDQEAAILPNLYTWDQEDKLDIQAFMDLYSAQLQSEEDGTLARVILPSFEVNSPDKMKFLRDLKILTRSLNAATIITIPKQFTSKKYMNQLLSVADCVIQLTSFFNDQVASTAYPGYDGALHLVKLPTINSLTCLPLKISQLGGRRVFIYKASLQRSLDVHMMHLQPEEESSNAASVACAPKVGGASLKSELQF